MFIKIGTVFSFFFRLQSVVGWYGMSSTSSSKVRSRVIKFLLPINILWTIVNLYTSYSVAFKPSLTFENVNNIFNANEEYVDLSEFNCGNIKPTSGIFPKVYPRSNVSNTPIGYWDMQWTNRQFDAHFLINPSHLCSERGSPPEVVFLVMSAVNASLLRNIVRSTWGAYSLMNGRRFAIVFVLGQSLSDEDNDEVIKESRRFKDVFVGDFIDSYHNLTIKTMVAYNWVAKACPRVSFVIRVTDDILFSFKKVEKHLAASQKKKVMFGPMFYNVYAVQGNKWSFTSPVKWPRNMLWDSIVHGTFLALSMDVVRDFTILSCKVAPLWPDDIYIAVLAEMLDIDVSSRGLIEIDFREVNKMFDTITTLTKNNFKLTPFFQLAKPRGAMMVHFGFNDLTPLRVLTLWHLMEEYLAPYEKGLKRSDGPTLSEIRKQLKVWKTKT